LGVWLHVSAGACKGGDDCNVSDSDCTDDRKEGIDQEATAAKTVAAVRGRMHQVLETMRLSPMILISRAASMLNPVLLAMFLSLFVGFCPPLQKALFVQGGSLSVIGDGATRIARAVPVIGLQILSGTLGCLIGEMWKTLRPPQKVADDCDSACISTEMGVGVQHGCFLDRDTLSWVGAAVTGKLVCMPVLCMLLTVCMQQYAEDKPAFGEIAFRSPLLAALWPSDHRLLRAIVFMQWSAPSCLSLVVLCHRACLGERMARAVAAMYLAMYPLAIVTSTVWLTCGLKQL